MITHVEGILEEKNPAYVILDVNGIGYFLHISLTTFSDIPEKGKLRLFTHLSIKEDAHTLFGFSTQSERTIYRQLISVSGVGPSTARMILSSLSPDETAHAIVSGDVNLLKKVKGIGAKTAQRVIIDLKDKVAPSSEGSDYSSPIGNTLRNEALSALIVLGIDKRKAETVIDKTIEKSGSEISVEELIKITLKSL
jgi:holliday junction DNA helicase RuvA